jgi:pheophorbide a oxygenase
VQAAPTWYAHFILSATLDGDNCFLHAQEQAAVRKARGEGVGWRKLYFMPTRADTMVIAFRDWVESVGGGGPFGPLHRAKDYPPLITDHRVLLNRYDQHTKNCTKCAAALANAQKLRAVTAAAAAIAWGYALVALVLWAIGTAPTAVPLSLGAGLGLALLLAWRSLGHFVERLLFVDYDHGRD